MTGQFGSGLDHTTNSKTPTFSVGVFLRLKSLKAAEWRGVGSGSNLLISLSSTLTLTFPQSQYRCGLKQGSDYTTNIKGRLFSVGLSISASSQRHAGFCPILRVPGFP